MKVYRENRSIAPHILTLDTILRQVVRFMTSPSASGTHEVEFSVCSRICRCPSVQKASNECSQYLPHFAHNRKRMWNNIFTYGSI